MSFTTSGILAPIPGAVQTVVYDANAASSAFTRSCVVEVTVTSAAHMLMGAPGDTPVATVANGQYLAAGVPRQFPILPTQKLAFIKAVGSVAGSAFLQEMQP